MNANMFVELSDDLAQNVGGGYYFGDPVYTNIYENLNINKNLNSYVNVYGHFAGAEAGSLALGPDSSTQAITYTATSPLGSQSQATSTAATNGNYYYFSVA